MGGGWSIFNLYKKSFSFIYKNIFLLFPLHCTSDRPCQLIIFPIENSLHEFIFQTFLVHEIFFCVPCSIFIFAFAAPPPPPPHHFSNGPPLTYEKSRFAKPMGNGKEFSHTGEKLSSNQMNINLFLAGNFPPGFGDDFVYFA